jgi:hypothetical protein
MMRLHQNIVLPLLTLLLLSAIVVADENHGGVDHFRKRKTLLQVYAPPIETARMGSLTSEEERSNGWEETDLERLLGHGGMSMDCEPSGGHKKSKSSKGSKSHHVRRYDVRILSLPVCVFACRSDEEVSNQS